MCIFFGWIFSISSPFFLNRLCRCALWHLYLTIFGVGSWHREQITCVGICWKTKKMLEKNKSIIFTFPFFLILTLFNLISFMHPNFHDFIIFKSNGRLQKKWICRKTKFLFQNFFWNIFNLLTFFGMTDLGVGFDGPYVRKFYEWVNLIRSEICVLEGIGK